MVTWDHRGITSDQAAPAHGGAAADDAAAEKAKKAGCHGISHGIMGLVMGLYWG